MPKCRPYRQSRSGADFALKSLIRDPYAHVQLPISNPKTIRLLEILPSRTRKGTHSVSCVLRLGSLSEAYIALSYMWGTEMPEKTITLNGLPFRIRQNLWDFLYQERINQARDGPRLLWIDALCIQQTSISERNHQVALMGQIYAKASSVMIWLGKESEKLAIWDYFDEFESVDPLRFRPYIDYSTEEWEPHFDAKREFCEHDYWIRAWILQECVLAAELQIQAGSRRISGSTLQKAYDFWTLAEGTFWKQDSYPLAGLYVLRVRKHWHNASARRYFCPWTSGAFKAGCSDQRDRIYSTIAMMDPSQKIVPDYNKTIPELFSETLDQKQIRSADIKQLAFLLDLIDGADWENKEKWDPVARDRWMEANNLEYAEKQERLRNHAKKAAEEIA